MPFLLSALSNVGKTVLGKVPRFSCSFAANASMPSACNGASCILLPRDVFSVESSKFNSTASCCGRALATKRCLYQSFFPFVLPKASIVTSAALVSSSTMRLVLTTPACSSILSSHCVMCSVAFSLRVVSTNQTHFQGANQALSPSSGVFRTMPCS